MSEVEKIATRASYGNALVELGNEKDDQETDEIESLDFHGADSDASPFVITERQGYHQQYAGGKQGEERQPRQCLVVDFVGNKHTDKAQGEVEHMMNEDRGRFGGAQHCQHRNQGQDNGDDQDAPVSFEFEFLPQIHLQSFIRLCVKTLRHALCAFVKALGR